MLKIERKQLFLNMFFSFFVSSEFCIFSFFTIHFEKIQNQVLFLVVLFCSILILISFIQIRNKTISNKIKFKVLIIIPITFALIILSLLCFYRIDYSIWKTKDLDNERMILNSGKELMFSNHKVMIFVPHEDDDVLLMGGVLEQYINYGSDVMVVFESTGDQGVSESGLNPGKSFGEMRMLEAINVLTGYGIKEKNIFFLGFGDGYIGKHLYNYHGEPDYNLKSRSGINYSYGCNAHLAYNEGEKLTKANFNHDIKELIIHYKPDVIFCNDYDSHPDHRAMSLSFEEVLATILKSENDYHPAVYKGFAYSTALKATNDFNCLNNASTINPYSTEYMLETNTYMWNNRIRFPVSIETLTHYCSLSNTSKKLLLYNSQHGTTRNRIESVVNSDKVFWERRTDSLLYNANISVSSGSSNVLSDFKLFDCNDINEEKTDYSNACGVWVPKKEDQKKAVSIDFDIPQNISSLVLYDNPSIKDNIIDATIVFDDGSIIHTGELVPNGSESVIAVDKSYVKNITITINKTIGTKAGLTEIEAYNTDSNENNNSFIKLMDANQNFVYDYTLNDKNFAEFSLYNYNYEMPLNSDNFIYEVSNKNVSVNIIAGKVIVDCPKGENSFVTILSKNNEVSDTIRVNNPLNTNFDFLGVKLYRYYQNNLTTKSQIQYVKRFIQGIKEIASNII